MVLTLLKSVTRDTNSNGGLMEKLEYERLQQITGIERTPEEEAEHRRLQALQLAHFLLENWRLRNIEPVTLDKYRRNRNG